MNETSFRVRPTQITYDRVEVLAFSDGTYGKHCVKQYVSTPSRHALPQPSWSHVASWREINPEIVGVRFEYMNPRCEIFVPNR